MIAFPFKVKNNMGSTCTAINATMKRSFIQAKILSSSCYQILKSGLVERMHKRRSGMNALKSHHSRFIRVLKWRLAGVISLI